MYLQHSFHAHCVLYVMCYVLCTVFYVLCIKPSLSKPYVLNAHTHTHLRQHRLPLPALAVGLGGAGNLGTAQPIRSGCGVCGSAPNR
jgi:hypothetical protein